MEDKIFGLEILAPAGSFDALVAAVRSGANAVYLGLRELNARAGAENFDFETLPAAVEYCRERNVKVYLTLNTIVFDHETDKALAQVRAACEAGADAIIVQDIGLAALVKRAAPVIRLHASTQMSVHTPSGIRLLEDLGFDRVVLARELSRDEIGEIIASCSIECEVFIHGAHCMSVSGQCFMSSVLGQRSGNRGQCAQPCRLPFSADKSGSFDLSLKDLSLIERLPELAGLGVKSLKIEGRLKRPEYVAAAVSAARAAASGQVPKEEMERLWAVFSRSGFTDGYFTGRRGPEMFGIRQRDDVVSATEKLLSSIRGGYKNENPIVPVFVKFEVKSGKAAVLEVTDGVNVVKAEGSMPERAEIKAIDEERVRVQLCKTGGTPYYVKEFECKLEPGLTLPVAQLNDMRRRALEELGRLRRKALPLPCFEPVLELEEKRERVSPSLRVRVADVEQVSDIMKGAQLIFVPVNTAHERLLDLRSRGFSLGVEIPRAMFGAENEIRKRLEGLRFLGIRDVLANNLGAVKLALEMGFDVHGGFGLNVANTYGIKLLEGLGVVDCTLSFETKLSQALAIGGSLKRGIIAWGRLPLMLVRNCPVKRVGCVRCGKKGTLTDRMGKEFPVMCDSFGCSEILNSVPLYMADRLDELEGLDFLLLQFTLEDKDEAAEVVRWYLEGGQALKEDFTRGLYYRGVKGGD